MSDSPAAPAGWYSDPDDPGLNRYWTGIKWTEDRSPAIAAPAPTPVSGATTPNLLPQNSSPQIVYMAKSTTAAVLLWLFLGNLGAHRHYVRKHGAGVAQPILLLLGSILMYTGLLGNPFYLSDGLKAPMIIYWMGVILVGLTALWVFFDVFFLAGWVRNLNEEISRPSRGPIAERKQAERGQERATQPSPYQSRSLFDGPPRDPVVLDPAAIPWELREDRP